MFTNRTHKFSLTQLKQRVVTSIYHRVKLNSDSCKYLDINNFRHPSRYDKIIYSMGLNQIHASKNDMDNDT